MQQIRCYSFILWLCCFWLNTLSIYAQVPRLRTPENGKVFNAEQVLLRWSLLNSVQFELQLANDAAFSQNVQTYSAIAANSFLANNLVAGQTYFWRVKSTQPLGNYCAAKSFSVFRPTLIDSCQLWLRADTGVTLSAGLVSSWLDSSPNQILVSQSTATLQPTLLNNAFNQLPSVNFDGTDRFVVPNVNFGDDNTGFIVAKNNPGSNPFTRVFIGGYNYNFDFFADACQIQIGFITTGAHNADTLSQITLLRQPGNSRAFKNGIQSGPTYTNSLNSMVPGNLFIGNRNDLARPLAGQISEILIYNVALADVERMQIENYLLWKYTPDLFLGNDTLLSTSLCPYTLSASAEFNRFIWSTGDTTSSIQVAGSGSYFLSARDYFGRWHQDTIVVNFPQINQLNDVILCSGNSIVWNSNVSPALTTVWNTGLVAPSISIDSAGFYSYEISDANGCFLSSDTIEVSIDNFSLIATLGNDTALCEGNLLTILNQTAPLASVLWSTGVSTEQIPIFNAGTYSVQAINTNNCIVNDTIVVSIGGIAPQVDFSYTTVCEGMAVDFTDLSTPFAGDVLTAWEWNFGNGNISSSQNASFTFPDSGSFPVSLKAIVNTGCANIITKMVEVIAYPKADFFNLNICDNAAASFFDLSNAYNGQINGWLWNFDDPTSGNNSSNLQQGQHLFSASGNFNVTLIVENLQGCSDTITKNIYVKPAPEAEILTLNQCEREAAQLVDVTQIPFPWELLERKWTLWNGSITNTLSINADTLGVGNYAVSLYVLATNGCSDTLQQMLSIYPHPQASYSITSPCVGTETILENTSQCMACTIAFQWWSLNQIYMGDSVSQSIPLSDTGEQFVSLIVENNFGCSDTLLDSFLPGLKPIALFEIINPVLGVGDPILVNNLSQGANAYTWNLGDGTTIQGTIPEYFYSDTGTFFIKLIATNNQDCQDNFEQIIQVRMQSIDLALEELSYQVNGDGYIRPLLTIRNLGTRLERKFDIELTAALETPLREEWTGLLLPGQSQQYLMKSSFLADTSAQVFFCIHLRSSGTPQDVNLLNNQRCLNFGSNESLVMGSIFPNPANNAFTLPLIAKDQSSCTIQILDALGQAVFAMDKDLQKGVNLIKIYPPSLPSGLYSILVNSGGKQIARTILISATE